MASSYTTLLGFVLPVTGELSGTWGDTVNNSLTELVEDAIAGTATASVTGGNWTLSTTGSGAVNESRCAILIPTGSPGTPRNIIAPSQSKAYVVNNQSDSIITIKGAATSGVSISSGSSALVVWSGSDFVRVGVSIGGSTNQVQYNSSGVLSGSANLTFDGTTLTAAGFSGPITGNVTGNVTGNLTGNVTGNVTGGLTGNVTGNVTGNINGTVGAITPTTGIFTQLDLTAQGDLRLQDTSGGEYVAHQAASTVSSSYTITWPGSAPSNGQSLTSDGSGNLSWVTPSAFSTSSNYTWTGNQTFTNSVMRLLGSSTGYTTFTSLNSSSTNYTLSVPAENMTIGFRNLPAVGSKTTSYSLTTSDVGKYVEVGSGGSITIPDSTFSSGDAITIFNNTSGDVTITCSITTAYISGVDSDKATMTLSSRGVATALFISGTVCVVSGNVS